MKIRNTFIIFLVSGFWHGANWTFIAWGAYNALLFLPLILLKQNRKHTDTVAEGKLFPNFEEFFEIIITFLLVVIGWIFFRADTISIAFDYLKRIFSETLFEIPNLINRGYYIMMVLNLILLFVVEWMQREKKHGLEIDNIKFHYVKFSIYFGILALIFWFGGKEQQFIYFQF